MNDEFDYDKTGLDLTVASEGMRLTAYPDPGTGADPWTIGVGHTGPDVFEGRIITQEEGYQLLHDDIQVAVRAVKQYVTVQLTQDQFDALVDFAFNCGGGNLEHSTLLRLLNSGDSQGASAHFLDWVKGGGRVLPGLVTRRKNEQGLFNA